jgi:hypothetical protein
MRWGFISGVLVCGLASGAFGLLGCSSSSDGTPSGDSIAMDASSADVALPSDAEGSDATTPPDGPALTLCTSDTDCDEEGATCTCNGVCQVFDTNPCLVDKNCPSDHFCDVCAGFCAPEVGVCEPCTNDGACGDGGACLPFASGGSFCGNECISDLGCDVGYSCSDVEGYAQKLCVPDSGKCEDLGLCESDGECPDGQVCSDNLKICAPGCTEDDQCSGNLVCEAARCVEPCATAADCPQGAECVEGHCKVPGACEGAVDCFEPETYCDKSIGQCVPGCLVDTDCQDAAKVCESKACVPKGCIHNYQCGFEEVCDKPTGACMPSPDDHCGVCESGAENQCGGDPNLCVTLQDEDPNTGETVDKGDFCLLPCAEDPVDQCPQGYSCTHIQMDTIDGFYCTRACWVNPVGAP